MASNKMLSQISVLTNQTNIKIVAYKNLLQHYIKINHII